MFSTNLTKVPEVVKERLDAAAQTLQAYNQELQDMLKALAARQQEQLEMGKKRAEEFLNTVETQALVQKILGLFLKIQELTSEWQTMAQEHLSKLLELVGKTSTGLEPKTETKTVSKEPASEEKKTKKAKRKKTGAKAVKKSKTAKKKAPKKSPKKVAKKPANKAAKRPGK